MKSFTPIPKKVPKCKKRNNLWTFWNFFLRTDWNFLLRTNWNFLLRQKVFFKTKTLTFLENEI